jgi:hypothetical protein
MVNWMSSFCYEHPASDALFQDQQLPHRLQILEPAAQQQLGHRHPVLRRRADLGHLGLDPLAPQIIDATVALRDALRGVGTPANWMRDQTEMDQIKMAEQERQQAEALLATASQGAQIAEQMGAAKQSLAPAPQPVAA